MNKYYEEERCNVNRGDFETQKSTPDDLEEARTPVAKLLHVNPEKIMFTTGATWFKHGC